MNKVLRALAVVLLALVGGIGATQVAAAQEDGCTVQGAGYVPGGPCEMQLRVAPTCAQGVPLLIYSATIIGSKVTTLDITWGADRAVNLDLQLEGAVPWPGTVLDASGAVVDWPGWTRTEGGWVEGDTYDWALGPLPVTFAANPSATATVTYPANCGPVSSGGGGTSVGAGPQVTALSETGLTSGPLVVAAAGLLGLGALLVLLARRRGRTSHV